MWFVYLYLLIGLACAASLIYITHKHIDFTKGEWWLPVLAVLLWPVGLGFAGYIYIPILWDAFKNG